MLLARINDGAFFTFNKLNFLYKLIVPLRIICKFNKPTKLEVKVKIQNSKVEIQKIKIESQKLKVKSQKSKVKSQEGKIKNLKLKYKCFSSIRIV